MLVPQSCPSLCNPMDYNPSGSTVQGILQARILEWVAISFSRGSSLPRDQIWVSCIAGRFFTVWATREALCPQVKVKVKSLSCARLFATPWIVACTKLLRPWDFQSKKYWSGLPFPSPKPLLIWRLALLSSSSVLLSNADWLDRHQVSTFCHSTSVTAKNIFYPSLES